MNRTNFERLHVYQLAEKLADQVWTIVVAWEPFARGAIGRQLVRSADSIGANIAEGSGRNSTPDRRHFVRVARGSLYETQHWLRRAYKRTLLTQEQIDSLKEIIDNLSPMLNAYLKSIGTTRTIDDRGIDNQSAID